VIKIRERVIISGDLQARVRSANGNQLTLARERQAKQSCALLWSPWNLCRAWLWLLAFFATCYDDRIHTTGLMPDR
jgi:hypothetical protein